MDIEKKLNHQCVFFWVLICDSAKNLESAKPGSQVVGKNVICWTLFLKTHVLHDKQYLVHFQSMLF